MSATHPRPETCAVRTGIATDTHHGAVVPPIHLSSTFAFDGYQGKRTYDYTRSGNPTRDILGQALSELEGGAGATVVATGMAAVTLVLQLLRPGDRLVAPHDCYGGTRRLMDALADRGAFLVDYVNQSDATALEAALATPAALVWVETPSNPLLRVTDLRFAARLAHAAGALLAADNTFLSPALQQPIALGADLVVHSTTKYLNGHSDVVGGAVVARTATLAEQVAWWANCLGLTASPFDAYLTLRGLRTLHVRLRSHLENAAAVADLLVRHPAVASVNYPGLADHPGHAVAARQQKGFGAMLSFELVGGEASVPVFRDGLTYFTLAESLGGVESLVAHPASMTHSSITAEQRATAGITDGLLRLSVGIEAAEDLVADLRAALDRVASVTEQAVAA